MRLAPPIRLRFVASIAFLCAPLLLSRGASAVAQQQAPRVQRIALVLCEGAELLELTGPAQILDELPGFVPYTVAATRDLITTDLATIVPDYTFADAPIPDVILVSSGQGGLRDVALRDWLRKHGPRAAAVMSDCNGALVLANAGLLDGRKATCPGGNLEGIMLLGKNVTALRGARVVRDGNIVTCDSWFAGVDGALEVASFIAGEASARASAQRNRYDWRPEELAKIRDAAKVEPPSHRLEVLRTVTERGIDAALAEYRGLVAGVEPGSPAAREQQRDPLGFHILVWTLVAARRFDQALALSKWTVAAFPDSALAITCVGEALFESGRLDEALAKLLEADQRESGEERALWLLPQLLRRPELTVNENSRRARQLLRRHVRESSATLTPPGETGERMSICGTVRDDAGQPVAGALVYVFHADARGFYTPSAVMGEPDARLFAFLRTDGEGRYEFTTVRPGGYPQPRKDIPATGGDERWIPQHVHYEVEAPRHARRQFQLVFRDDPRMTSRWQKWAAEDGHPIIDLARDGAGTLRGTCDIVLRRE